MRNFLIILLLIVAGIIAAVIIGFDIKEMASDTYYDDEQEGLDEQIIIRLSYVTAENTPKGRTASRFATLVEDKTNGQVIVHLFPNATLYNDKNEWKAVQNGNVEMIAPATAKISEHYPEWQILDLPFAFPNYRAVEAAYEGEIGETLLEELDRSNVKGLDLWYNGFKQITNRDYSIKTPDDFSRLHFRTMPGEVIQEQFNQLNASSSTLPFSKTYQNLEVNFVDAQENTLSNINTKKFYDYQQYLTISNHGYLGYGVLINRDFWNSLSPSIQKAINDSISEATDWGRRHAIEINDQHARALRSNKSLDIYTLSAEERAQWFRTLQPLYDKTRQTVGSDLMKELNQIKYQHAY
ncbi:DctP family TRAP transporter solute-binding subunit [Lentibacillus salicampi]|uniref:DctP family TRAP transporter solute-binding subunit n=1 Tax=Lentibacillus salicampi TaxID=175306 RepID=UPI001FD7DEE4|nr:DctP family TRAP transporter solute-binding subunit [Lentibacillus salicampi]